MSATDRRLDFRNTNSLWGSVLVETFYRLGLREVVISPGSRSTPLTIAFARHPGIESIPVLDERSAAFFALGLARQHHRPVALLCTSGTAGANYYPAVIEAQESGVPLVVITADRPPEMRECRSGQTIDQQKLFGGHVNFYHEFAVPVASMPMLRYLRQTVVQTWERCQWPCRGPVHLNAPFRDPLPPVADGLTEGIQGEINERQFFGGIEPIQPISPGRPVALRLTGRGVIVAGQARPKDSAKYAARVGRLAKSLGWPVLADALSPLRHHAHLVPNLISSYDLIARSSHLRTELQPERVLCLHDWPTSKALRQWLGESDLRVTMVSEHVQNPDALHNRTRLVRSSVELINVAAGRSSRDRGWAKSWIMADQKLQRSLVREIGRIPRFFEGQVASGLTGVLPAKTPLFVANSMPVRDLEYFCPANRRQLEVHCNRGANGIDGTLSTALGLAHGNRPAVMLTGDLALLHDSNGLLSLPKFRGSLSIILINNDGGGIFGHLPVAKFNPPFEEFFATPQKVDFRRWCSAYGAKHVLVRNWEHLGALLKRLPANGVRVLEVRTDRQLDAADRQRIFANLSA